MIHIDTLKDNACARRMLLAENVWGLTKKKLFQNTAINRKVRIILWNALIRSILKYALHAKKPKYTDVRGLETFAVRCIKRIKDTMPQYRASRIERTQNYKDLQIPTINMARKTGNNATSSTNAKNMAHTPLNTK